MVRNVLGSVVGLVGATAAVLSPFRAWYDGRLGRDYRLGELFSAEGISDAHATVMWSLFLPFACAAVLTLVAVVLRSRILMALAGVVVLGFTVLWMVRQGQAAGELAVGNGAQGLGPGVANALGGGLFLLIGAAVMSGRRPRQRVGGYEADTARGAPPGRDTATARIPRAYDPGGQGRHRAPDAGADHGPALGAPLHETEPGPDAADHGPPLGPPSHGGPPGPTTAQDDEHGPALGAPLHETEPRPDGPDHGPPLGPPLNSP
ncbi:hypothetical protein [Streptomyces sp. NRRL S-87]|uniref:hypothetical protein n=1 Tax=Streptomyces sp. NRRL S-87 TaxID=1463920 RepID=UPI0007C57C8B|nr:hypothetical protein [Streptomyces sp. NRRL S-87]